MAADYDGMAVKLSIRTIAQVYVTSEIIAWQDSYHGSVQFMGFFASAESKTVNHLRNSDALWMVAVWSSVVGGNLQLVTHSIHRVIIIYRYRYVLVHTNEIPMKIYTLACIRWRRWPQKMGKPAQQPNACVSEQSVLMHTAPRIHYIRFVSC